MIFQGKTKQGDFALETSVKAITYYKDFFGVPYPLPKYDCIAISDFSCGAMENWGLVTFRETAVLCDSQNTSAKAKQWIAIGSFLKLHCNGFYSTEKLYRLRAQSLTAFMSDLHQV